MTPERLEELRQIAGGINGTKSNWMDELIEYIDRLRAENYLLCDELKRVNESREFEIGMIYEEHATRPKDGGQ